MHIKQIEGGYITVSLEVSTCLTIASACHCASTACHDDRLPIHGQAFELLRAAFEAYALVGAARSHMKPGKDYDDFTLDRIREEWGELPLILEGKEVVK